MSHKRGVTLIATIFILLVVALLAITTSTFVASDATIAVRNYYSQDAFYIASAGMEFYLQQLESDSDWSTPPAAKTRAFSGGTFVVTTTNESNNRITFTVTGIVTVDSRTFVRAIQPTIQRTAGGIGAILDNYVIYWGGGSGSGSTIGNNSTIIGSIFINDDLAVGNNILISGDALSTGNIDLGSGTNVTGTLEENAEPPLGVPTLETTWYDQKLAYCATQTAGNRTWSGTNNLSGYYWVRGDVTFNNGATINITGSATIVATGKVTVNNNVIFGDYLTVIASKEIVMDNNVTIGEHGLWYSRTLIQVGNNAEVSDVNVGEGTAFITPGDIDFGNNIEFYGFIYCGDDFVQTGNNFYFEGNMIVGGDISVDNNTTITLNPELIDPSLLIGIGATGGETGEIVDITGWDEVY